jgi:hypothetical protein
VVKSTATKACLWWRPTTLTLLRNLPDKAKAWADLVLAMQVVRGQ